MYAVVEMAGVQYKVAESEQVRISKVDTEVGKSIDFDRVLLVADGDDVRIGKPLVPNVKVQATVLAHGRDEKVRVFKKKKRKNYQVLRGHRQPYTDIKIEKILV